MSRLTTLRLTRLGNIQIYVYNDDLDYSADSLAQMAQKQRVKRSA